MGQEGQADENLILDTCKFMTKAFSRVKKKTGIYGMIKKYVETLTTTQNAVTA